VVVLGALACSSSGGGGGGAVLDASTETGVGGSSGTGGTGGSAGGATGGGAGSAGTPAGGSGGGIVDAGLMLGPADLACVETGAEDACISCCSEAHATWTIVAPATRACVCESPGVCASECAPDYCLEQPGNPACIDCIFPTLAPGAECYAPSQAICAGDSDCLTYVDCRANCVSTLPP
jgi:hypothetical protein